MSLGNHKNPLTQVSELLVRSRYGFPTALTIGTYGRHGSLRRLGHAGSAVGIATPGTTGRTRLDGMEGEKAMETVAVPLGTVWLKDHTG